MLRFMGGALWACLLGSSALQGADRAGTAVEIIAHRGASFDAPENTRASVALAWERGADAVEIDIHLAKSGEIVVIHDADTERVAGVKKPVRDQSIEELRRLEVGGWKGEKWRGEPIPILSELLPLIPPGRRMFVEIKCGPEVVEPLARVMKSLQVPDRSVVFIAFDHDTLRRIRLRLPRYDAFWLVGWQKEPQPGKQGNAPIEELIRRCREGGFDGLNLNHQWPVDRAFVERLRKAGLGLYVWTVNDVEIARRWREAGVQGITTDRPDWLRSELGRAGSSSTP